MKHSPYFICINRCPLHGFYSVSLEQGEFGQRITPSKCCGRWETIRKWKLTSYDWDVIMRIGKDATGKRKKAKGASA